MGCDRGASDVSKPSLRTRAMNRLLKRVEKPRLAREQDIGKLRRRFEQQARWVFFGPRGARYAPGEQGGVPVLDVSVGDGAGETVLLYLHGGAYVMGSPNTHKTMVAKLCAMSGCRAVLPDYRKAPEHPFPAAVEDAVAVYRALLDEGQVASSIIIGGDSAGGGLALALLGEICRLGLDLPGGLFALSPLTDVTFSGASIAGNADVDALLPASRVKDLQSLYLQEADPRDPRCSPLFADFTRAAGVCPVWLTVGDTEILRDDSVRMAERLEAQGVNVSFTIERDLPHVWPMFHNTLPEAGRSLRDIAGWIRSRSGH